MKRHFGIMENWGDYEHSCIGCEQTLCGNTSEEVCENATSDWELVTCKKCLKLKEDYERGVKEDEEVIVRQMGEMVDFLSEQQENKDTI